MNIENMTSAELFILAENKKAEEILNNEDSLITSPIPKVVILKNTDTNKRLIECAESYIKDCLEGREIDENWAFETVMELVYGKDIWEWWNKRF